MLGMKQVYPGRYDPDMLVKLWREEKVTFSHCVPTILQMLLNCQGRPGCGLRRLEDHHRRQRAQPRAVRGGQGPGHPADGGVRHVGDLPLISAAHLNDELQAGSEDERTTYRIKAGVPVPLVEAAIVDGDGNFLPADGESQGELVLRAPWLTRATSRSRKRARSCGRAAGCTPATSRPSTAWVHRHPRPHQGCDQDRRRVDLVAGPRRPGQPPSGGARSGGGRRGRSAVGRAPVCLLVVREGHEHRRVLKEHLKPFVEQGHINKWAIPSQIAIVTEIPKTSVGKLDKKRIRLDITSGRPATAPSFPRSDCVRPCRRAGRMLERLGLAKRKNGPCLSTASTRAARSSKQGAQITL
jgi:fatty-acyl-CoA synthase